MPLLLTKWDATLRGTEASLLNDTHSCADKRVVNSLPLTRSALNPVQPWESLEQAPGWTDRGMPAAAQPHVALAGAALPSTPLLMTVTAVFTGQTTLGFITLICFTPQRFTESAAGQEPSPALWPWNLWPWSAPPQEWAVPPFGVFFLYFMVHFELL